MKRNWLEWGIKLQAISQTGLHFTENRYDRERHKQDPPFPLLKFFEYYRTPNLPTDFD